MNDLHISPELLNHPIWNSPPGPMKVWLILLMLMRLDARYAGSTALLASHCGMGCGPTEFALQYLQDCGLLERTIDGHVNAIRMLNWAPVVVRRGAGVIEWPT